MSYALGIANDPFAVNPEVARWCIQLRVVMELNEDQTLSKIIQVTNEITEMTRFGPRQADEYFEVRARYWAPFLAEITDGAADIRAVERIGIDLHPFLAAQFKLGRSLILNREGLPVCQISHFINRE